MKTKNENVKVKTDVVEPSYSDILDSFTSGSGKTNDLKIGYKLSEKIHINGLRVWMQGSEILFKSEQHRDAYFATLLHKEHKDKSSESRDEFFKHISSGYYVSLNHTDKKPKTVASIFDQYANKLPGITNIGRVGKGSKMFIAYCTPAPIIRKQLEDVGFTVHKAVVDDDTDTTIGYRIELPKEHQALENFDD